MLLWAISISIFYLAWGLFVTDFFFCFAGLEFEKVNFYSKREKNPSCACGLILMLFGCTILMESTLFEGFVEKKYEINSPAWSGKTTEGQASLSDCHKTAKIMSGY
jgi:hypothetical protein